MRKPWIAAIVIVGILAGGMMLMARLNRSPWTTKSAAALLEFQKGLDAEMKYYGADARNHYRRAVELDPEFVVAKLSLLLREPNRLRRAELHSDISQASLDELSERERFMVRYLMAGIENRPDEAERVITEYLAKNPKDPYALGFRCTEAWDSKDLEKAERLYKQLLEADPNWVIAQNHLGYIAMAQGKFTQAEELFNTYKYVAPDQANPHDSLGELLTLLGRYDEARIELEEAVRIKPDFCASYNHLLTATVLSRDFDSAEAYLDAGQQQCGEMISAFSRCRLVLWKALLTGAYETAWAPENEFCIKRLSLDDFLVHRLAVLTGRREQALEIESALQDRITQSGIAIKRRSDVKVALVYHLEGARLLAEGDADTALDKFRTADLELQYWGQGQGLLKLFNRLHIAIALAELSQKEEAQELLTDVSQVNPSFTEFYSDIRDSLISPTED